MCSSLGNDTRRDTQDFGDAAANPLLMQTGGTRAARRATRALVVGGLVAAAALAPGAHADTAVWVPTFPVEPGTMTVVDANPAGHAAVVISGTDLFESDSAGLTWTPDQQQPPQGGSSQTRVAVGAGTVMFAENGDAVARTRGNNAPWASLKTPRVTKSKFFEWADTVRAVHAGHALAVGWDGAEVVDVGTNVCPKPIPFAPVFSSHDDGRSWTIARLPVKGWVDDVQWLDPRQALALVIEIRYGNPVISGNTCEVDGVETATSVWVTHDGGKRWHRSLRCAVDFCAAAAWVYRHRAMVVDHVGHSYLSTDDGNTFRRGPRIFTPLVPGLGFVQGFGFAAAQSGRGWVDTNGSGIFRTDDSGRTWSLEHSANDVLGYGVGSFAVIDGSRAIAAGAHAVLTRDAVGAAAAPTTTPSSGVVSITLFPGVTERLLPDGSRRIRLTLTS